MRFRAGGVSLSVVWTLILLVALAVGGCESAMPQGAEGDTVRVPAHTLMWIDRHGRPGGTECGHTKIDIDAAKVVRRMGRWAAISYDDYIRGGNVPSVCRESGELWYVMDPHWLNG